ncbi:uncharacterized protein LOC134910928 [Pseudophryne corroboree]|uniref:uncharacterized protein LOC134910928 n=1 Tax=Pseudophryne corroboree TaxID=495146 RepID=UPI003081C9F4
MATWSEEEVRELLRIRVEAEIANQITGTVKDAITYENITRMLAASSFQHTSQQVINQLKALKRNFNKVHDHNRNRSGAARMEWQYYEQCATIFGHTALTTHVNLSSSLAAAETSQACATCSVQDPETQSPPPPSPPLVLDNDTQPMQTTMTDPIGHKPSRTANTNAPEDTETGTSKMDPIAQRQPLCGNIYTVLPRRRHPNKTEQAARIMTTVLVEKLEQMDAAMGDREDARLNRFLQAKQDMNNTFMAQLNSMQETYNRDARECQREMQEFQMSIFDRMFQCIEGLHTVPPQHPPPNYPQLYPQYNPGSPTMNIPHLNKRNPNIPILDITNLNKPNLHKLKLTIPILDIPNLNTPNHLLKQIQLQRFLFILNGYCFFFFKVGFKLMGVYFIHYYWFVFYYCKGFNALFTKVLYKLKL